MWLSTFLTFVKIEVIGEKWKKASQTFEEVLQEKMGHGIAMG